MNMKNVCIVIIILFIIFIQNLHYYLRAQPINQGANVKIIFPEENSTVSGFKQIATGSVSGLKQSDIHVYILIHPLVTRFWWVQPPPNVDEAGQWRCIIYLGEYDRGNNEDYAIKAVIVKGKIAEATTYKMDDLPVFIDEHQIFVHRKDITFFTRLIDFIISTEGISIIIGVLGLIVAIYIFKKQKKVKVNSN